MFLDGGRLSSDVEHAESPAGQASSQTGYDTSPQVPGTSQEGQGTSPGIEESTTTYGYGGTDSSPQAKPPPVDGLNSLDKSGLTVDRQKTHPSMASYRYDISISKINQCLRQGPKYIQNLFLKGKSGLHPGSYFYQCLGDIDFLPHFFSLMQK